jgi:hypothetical protein
MSDPINAAIVFLVPTGALLAVAAFVIYSCLHRTPNRGCTTGRAAIPHARPHARNRSRAPSRATLGPTPTRQHRGTNQDRPGAYSNVDTDGLPALDCRHDLAESDGLSNAKRVVGAWIEDRYNRRRHSSIGQISPVAFELQYSNQTAADQKASKVAGPIHPPSYYLEIAKRKAVLITAALGGKPELTLDPDALGEPLLPAAARAAWKRAWGLRGKSRGAGPSMHERAWRPPYASSWVRTLPSRCRSCSASAADRSRSRRSREALRSLGRAVPTRRR